LSEMGWRSCARWTGSARSTVSATARLRRPRPTPGPFQP